MKTLVKKQSISGILFALFAAVLYAFNIPIAKVMLGEVSPSWMASLLYFGAGFGIAIIYGFRKHKDNKRDSLTKAELPYIVGMVMLDILAPILLMYGLTTAMSANAALLTNFEIVATTIIALIVFKETISQRLWIAISLIMVASIILGLESFDALSFSSGSLLVLLATCCWGMENNVTRKLATKNTYQIVIIKGVFSGLGSLIVALVLGDALPTFIHLLITLMLGLITYGISIFLYVRAQRTLGASQTSAYYAITPFIGALLGLFLNQETFNIQIIIAFAIMIIATIMTIRHTLKHHHKQ